MSESQEILRVMSPCEQEEGDSEVGAELERDAIVVRCRFCRSSDSPQCELYQDGFCRCSKLNSGSCPLY
ncbi:hypothetical protein [Dongshaea marina]|uniref:hypothetical protein n=1 Tax=Dongshaea marina TaxID=2047966 RepID=UPI000D3E03DC|nr:hypothetical protein [Dongshaea marina]